MLKRLTFKLIFLFISLFSLIHSSGQSITGRVTANQEALPNATINFRTKGLFLNSQLNGTFSYTVPPGAEIPFLDTLEVSFIGYKTESIPIYFQGNDIKLTVDLKPNSEILNEAVINARKSYTALEILLKAQKNLKKNYSNKTTLSNGFYRELTSENQKATTLSEAVLQVQYSPYPQRNFYKKAFRNFYNLAPVDWLKTVDVPSFKHTIIFPEYIPIGKDEVELKETRVSDNLTATNHFYPTGGPTDLLALDKLKYGTDFFDKKVQKQYEFEKAGVVKYKDQYCYVIRFKPNAESKLRLRSPFNKQTQSAVFQGEILISTDRFSVLYMEYKLYPNIPFEHKRKEVSLDKVTVEYEKLSSGRLHLKSVTSLHTKHLTLNNSTTIPASCERQLLLFNTETSSNAMDEKNRFYTSYGNNLFYNHFSYNKEFWENYQLSSEYPHLRPSAKKELSIEIPLEIQFNSINVSIDSITAPSYKEEKYFFKDNLSLLKDKEHFVTKALLKQENDYYNEVMAKLKSESKAYISEYARSFKYKKDTSQNTYFISVSGIKYRFKRNLLNEEGLYVVQNNNSEKRILNLTALASERTNFNIEKLEISSDTVVIYSFSEKGRIWSQLEMVKNEKLLHSISHTSEFDLVHDSILIYTSAEPPSFRESKLFAFHINSGENVELFYENDVTYGLDLQNSSMNGRRELFVSSASLDDNQLYHITGFGNLIYCDPIISAKNTLFSIKDFEQNGIVIASKKSDENHHVYLYDLKLKKNIRELYSSNSYIDDYLLLKDYLVINQYEKLSSKIVVIDLVSGKHTDLKFKEKKFFAEVESSTKENEIKVYYSSYQTPYLELDIELENPSEAEIISETEHFKNQKFTRELRQVNSTDAEVPLTLYYNKDVLKDSINGIILKVYGAYGSQSYPSFSREEKAYMNLGFIIAHAHVRGNSDKGWNWYTEGKTTKKLNTFLDYIACAEYLTSEFNLDRNQLIGYGQSAGGLVMGYVANTRPELFGTLIFDRPYLDVVHTMNDPDLPLTTLEYKEWGNPENLIEKDYMASYSPYQNIQKANYPHMFFWAGLEDQQTPYWQVLSSVMKYRQNQLGDSKIIFKCNSGEGHKGSVSSHSQKLKESQIFAFIQKNAMRKME